MLDSKNWDYFFNIYRIDIIQKLAQRYRKADFDYLTNI